MTVHHNLQVLVTETFKVKNDLIPYIMKDVFELKIPPMQSTVGVKSLYTCIRLLTMYVLLSIKLQKHGTLLESVRLYLRTNPQNLGILIIVRVGPANPYNIIRFRLKRIHTFFYARPRLYTYPSRHLPA